MRQFRYHRDRSGKEIIFLFNHGGHIGCTQNLSTVKEEAKLTN